MLKTGTVSGSYKSYSDEAYDTLVRQPNSEDTAERYRKAVEQEISERSAKIPTREEQPERAAAAAFAVHDS